MATLFDSNIWVALAFSTHPHHGVAQDAFSIATLETPVVFCRATQQSFLRLATTPALVKTYTAGKFTNRDALTLIASYEKHPKIRFLSESRDLQALWHRLADLPTASPKVWMDAYLAAFAISHEIEFVTFDRDFRNFEKQGLDLRVLLG